MRRERRLFASAILIFVALALIGCPPKTEDGAGEAAYDTEAWAWLQTTKEELEAKRQTLSQLKDYAAGKLPAEEEATAEEAEGEATAEEAEGEATAEDFAALSPEELEQRISDTKAEVLDLSDEFGRRLAEFINSQNITVGGELTEVQKQALRLNSDEAIYAAQDFIDIGGDYQRAIDIYTQALTADSDNEKLQAAIASAEERRHMTEERFAAAKKKMTENEIRAALGPVNLRNIQEYPEKGVKGWFYPKTDGGAAAVWFKETKAGNGDWRVYRVNFEEVKQKVIGGSSEESADEGA